MTRMSEAHIVVLAIAIACLPCAAQRVDGCSADGHHISFLSDEEQGRALLGAGHPLSKSSLISTLGDSSPSMRSLAALKLASFGEKGDIAVLMRVWSAEADSCSKFQVGEALRTLLLRHWVVKPEPTQRIVPFEACAPSSPAIISLRLEQMTPETWWTYQGPTVRMTVRNLTSETLPFLRGSFAELFSATVLDPHARQAEIPAAQACYYKKCDPKSDPTVVESGSAGFGPAFFQPLPPRDDDNSWIWYVGQDFDMSAPGIYSVSLGAKLDYLDTTVCSNTAFVTVK